MTGRSRFLSAWLVGGLGFLYLPIALLVATSFNASRLTTVWSGLSLRWYVALWQDDALMQAAWLSLVVAVLSSTLATVLGAASGFALARFGRFPGRGLFTGLLTTPLLLPDLLIGLALLLLFVAMEQLTGWPRGRGAGTIVLAHATIGLSYVTLVVRARLADGGIALEQAAMDLGATPARAFRHVTLPLMAPALLAGWLLCFTLSLDDVIVASFVSGPGATTLPMLVYSSLKLGATPVLNALATEMLAVVASLLVAAWALAPVAQGKGRD
jgi:putrescine transport system permease protein